MILTGDNFDWESERTRKDLKLSKIETDPGTDDDQFGKEFLISMVVRDTSQVSMTAPAHVCS